MNSIDSRREFLAGLVASAAIPVSTALAFAGADRRIRFGYTAMTWGKEEKRAIEDIHNHMNTINEHPGNLDVVMETSDPKYVGLLLDTAHSLAGGGDPAAALRKYCGRVLLVHLKDVVDIPADTPGAKYPFQFVELGSGRVDLPAVFSALNTTDFRGWAVVELDRVPEKSRTPLESAEISRKFLEQKIGVKFPAIL